MAYGVEPGPMAPIYDNVGVVEHNDSPFGTIYVLSWVS